MPRALLFPALLFLAAQPLFAAGRIEIAQVVFSLSEDGPPVDGDFQPGENVYLSFSIANYKISPLEKVQISYRLTAQDPRGIPIVAPVKSKLEAALAPQDKDWRPRVHEVFAIPPIAPAGDYAVHVSVTDELSQQTVEKDLTVKVRTRNVEPSDVLALRDFGFYRGEDDPNPIPSPVYGPGATVYARFDIAGYKYGSGNSVEVSYDVAMLNAEGKSLYSQPAAAVEKTSGFYPQPWVPAGMSLNLDKNIRPGDYTVVITLHDAVGKQVNETRHVFQVQ